MRCLARAQEIVLRAGGGEQRGSSSGSVEQKMVGRVVVWWFTFVVPLFGSLAAIRALSS